MRLTGMTPLAELAPGQMPVDVQAFLQGLWVETFEEAVALAAASEQLESPLPQAQHLRQALAPILLNIDEAALAPWMRPPQGIEAMLGQHVEPQQLDHVREHGRLPVAQLSSSLSDEPLPPAVRLMDRLPPVRQQGERGTCVAFAVTALREFMLGSGEHLSEQFLYWACKQMDGMTEQPGTTIHVAMAALAQHGICEERLWPYDPHPRPGNEHHGPPPPQAVSDARKRVMPNARPVVPHHVEHYKRVLAGTKTHDGMPVATGVLVFGSWLYSAATTRTGKITLPLPGEKPLPMGHAMLVVGYQDDPSVPGGGYFIVRNSWGSEWAAMSPEAAGHALIPYDYMMRFALDAYAGEQQARESSNMPLARLHASAMGDADLSDCIVVLDDDMRDADGRLWKRGKRIIMHPDRPEIMLEDTPANRQRLRRLLRRNQQGKKELS